MADLSNPSNEASIDVTELRELLRTMSDPELRVFGRACVQRCSSKANRVGPPPDVFVIESEEARAEWQRRHPKK